MPLFKGPFSTYSEYRSLHQWVARRLGTPQLCENCDNASGSTIFDWANISGEYQKDLSDWARLCRWCHQNFDWREPVFKTHCIRGHKLDNDNLFFRPDGRRECVQCRAIHSKNGRLKAKMKGL